MITVGAVYGVRHFVGKLADQYTASAPIALPVVNIDAAQSGQLKARFEAFMAGLADDSGPNQLVLTDDELNAVINFDPNFAPLKGRAYVSFNNDRVEAKLSMPLESFGFSGRYLNGDGEVSVAMKNGLLEVYLKSLSVNGSPISQEFLATFSNQNLAAEMYKDSAKIKALQNLDSVVVRDNQLIVTRR